MKEEAGSMFTIVDGAFALRAPATPTTPVVLSVPHAGIATRGFDEVLSPELDVRCDADLHVDRLYRLRDDAREEVRDEAPYEAPETYVVAHLSRFVCDLNRDPDDVSPGAVPEHPAPRNTDGRGFIWAVTTAGAPALARPLSLADWRARTAIHATYHDAITQALARARDRFGFAVLVDGHSMPSRGRSGHKDPGRARADVVPGDREGTSCAPSLSALVGEHFTSRGYSVAFNEPYKGGFITAHHGRPADHIHAIQIELRRDLYMNESTYALVQPGFTRLSETLASLLEGLRAYRP